ncbi:MAG: hypothetical protein ACRC8E_00005, partial [Plesiomonas shigelloides]
RDPDLGKVVLYQLSYSRISLSITTFYFPFNIKTLCFHVPGNGCRYYLIPALCQHPKPELTVIWLTFMHNVQFSSKKV